MVLLVSRGFTELTAREFHDVVRLRCDVFVVEQACAYPELDGRDAEPGTVHHWFEIDGGVACYARTLVDPDGAIRIGRVATAPAMRGQGLASHMITALVTRHTGDRLVLDAQSQLVEWYRGLGFDVVGDEYVEDGIPHVPMRLTGA